MLFFMPMPLRLPLFIYYFPRHLQNTLPTCHLIFFFLIYLMIFAHLLRFAIICLPCRCSRRMRRYFRHLMPFWRCAYCRYHASVTLLLLMLRHYVYDACYRFALRCCLLAIILLCRSCRCAYASADARAAKTDAMRALILPFPMLLMRAVASAPVTARLCRLPRHDFDAHAMPPCLLLPTLPDYALLFHIKMIPERCA